MSRRIRRKSALTKAQKAQLRAQAGLDRKRFYENGGEACRWRGIHVVQEDQAKKANKRACRGRVRNDAGKE